MWTCHVWGAVWWLLRSVHAWLSHIPSPSCSKILDSPCGLSALLLGRELTWPSAYRWIISTNWFSFAPAVGNDMYSSYWSIISTLPVNTLVGGCGYVMLIMWCAADLYVWWVYIFYRVPQDQTPQLFMWTWSPSGMTGKIRTNTHKINSV